MPLENPDIGLIRPNSGKRDTKRLRKREPSRHKRSSTSNHPLPECCSFVPDHDRGARSTPTVAAAPTRTFHEPRATHKHGQSRPTITTPRPSNHISSGTFFDRRGPHNKLPPTNTLPRSATVKKRSRPYDGQFKSASADSKSGTQSGDKSASSHAVTHPSQREARPTSAADLRAMHTTDTARRRRGDRRRGRSADSSADLVSQK